MKYFFTNNINDILKKQSRIGFEYLFLSLVKYCFA